MLERRQVPRWKIDRDVRITFEGSSQSVHGRLLDLNFKGMQVELDERIPDKRPIRMDMVIDQRIGVTVDADVPWRRETSGRHVYGLCFNKVQDDDKDKIYQYVSSDFPQQLRQQWWGTP